MLSKIYYIFAGFLILGVTSAFAAEKAPQKVIDLANSSLVAYGQEPIIVQAVKEENANGKTLAEIKALDEEWKRTPGVADYMKALIVSECGKYVNKIITSKPWIAEIFVMDNQGANVAMTDKTSDYWQGDEAIFIQSFKNSQGTIYISNVEFDDSTQAYVAKVSIPVKDGEKAIGVITFSIDVNKL